MKYMHEEFAIVATVDPVDANNADSDSDVIDMNLWSELMIIILLGILNDSATNTVTVKDCATSGGSYAAITGKSQAIVGTDDAKQFVISVKAEEMNSGARYIKTTMDNSSHSQLMAIVVLGRAKQMPVNSDDLSTVQTFVV